MSAVYCPGTISGDYNIFTLNPIKFALLVKKLQTKPDGKENMKGLLSFTPSSLYLLESNV